MSRKAKPVTLEFEDSVKKDAYCIDRTANLMTFFANIQGDLNRIIDLVQKNPDFFNSLPGQSTVKNAADTLERLVAESKKA